MAWNQSANHTRKPQPVRRSGGLFRGIFVCIMACFAVGVWLMLLQHDAANAEQQPKKQAMIAEAKPDLTERGKSVAPVQDTKQEAPKPRPPQRVGELRDGYRLLPDGTLHRVLGIITNTPPKMSLADKTFNHSADVELGNLLMLEPGDDLLGSAEGMYKGFSKELDEALAEPIAYDKNDTDIQRELKEGVNELREELKQRRAAGEDIETLMEDTWNQLKELSLYKQELEDLVRLLSTNELTQKDYKDLVAAANQMLSERGIKPLEMPGTLKHTLRIRQIQAAAKRQEETKEVKTPRSRTSSERGRLAAPNRLEPITKEAASRKGDGFLYACGLVRLGAPTLEGENNHAEEHEKPARRFRDCGGRVPARTAKSRSSVGWQGL